MQRPKQKKISKDNIQILTLRLVKNKKIGNITSLGNRSHNSTMEAPY